METQFTFAVTKQRGKEANEKLCAFLTSCGFLSTSSYAHRLKVKRNCKHLGYLQSFFKIYLYSFRTERL